MTSSLSIDRRIKMADGNTIPQFGLGVYQAKDGAQAVKWALEAGYRHIDTAAYYENEADVGKAIKESKIPRDQIFVTTKIFDNAQGYEQTKAAFENSYKLLGLDYIDLYLIHSPNPGKEKRLATWKALEEYVQQGKIKSIGVSNYGVHHLQELLDTKPKVYPVINQIELHPWLTRDDIVSFCEKNNIIAEAYSPLTRGKKLSDPTVTKIAEKYSKSTAQILIRWSLQRNFVCIPKSDKEDRIKANADVFDFNLNDDDMKTLNDLDCYYTTGWDPTKSA